MRSIIFSLILISFPITVFPYAVNVVSRPASFNTAHYNTIWAGSVGTEHANNSNNIINMNISNSSICGMSIVSNKGILSTQKNIIKTNYCYETIHYSKLFDFNPDLIKIIKFISYIIFGFLIFFGVFLFCYDWSSGDYISNLMDIKNKKDRKLYEQNKNLKIFYGAVLRLVIGVIFVLFIFVISIIA